MIVKIHREEKSSFSGMMFTVNRLMKVEKIVRGKKDTQEVKI